jgi:hypothetical protein
VWSTINGHFVVQLNASKSRRPQRNGGQTDTGRAALLGWRIAPAARPPREGLRPLRDPATVHLDEDDDGTGE